MEQRNRISRRDFVVGGIAGLTGLCMAPSSLAFANEGDATVPVPTFSTTVRTPDGIVLASTDPNVPLALTETDAQYSIKTVSAGLTTSQIEEDVVSYEADYQVELIRSVPDVADRFKEYAIAYIEVKCFANRGGNTINVTGGYGYLMGRGSADFSVTSGSAILLVNQGPMYNGWQQIFPMNKIENWKYERAVNVSYPTINYNESDFNGALATAEATDKGSGLTMLVDVQAKF